MKNKIVVSIIIFLGIVVSVFIYNSNNVDLKYGDSVNISNYESINTSKSSFVDDAQYNASKQHLILKLNGNGYEYCGVPTSLWNSFKKASSYGSYYNSRIKGKYSCN